jgi:cytoskeletal protein CcmA (bactofilin family)
MKKHKIIIGALLLIGALTVGWAGLASAYSFNTGVNVLLGQGQKINHTVFAAGNTVDIASEVFGDIFCAGQTVTISGKVHGDVLCAGQTVIVNGEVSGDVRALGQTVNVGGHVGGNVSVGGQSFSLNSDAKVDGDLSVGAATATVNGRVGRDLALGGDNIVIAGQVGRNVQGFINRLQFSSGARVQGNVDYTSNLEAAKTNDVFVGGKLTRTDMPRQAQPNNRAVLALRVYWFAAMLFIALAFTLLFPSALHKLSSIAIQKPWKVMLVGLIASAAAPIVFVLLAITIIGLPLALIFGLLCLVATLLGWVVFSYYIGRLILKNSPRPLLIILTGASLVTIACMLPVIGFITFLVALWFGVGMVLLEAMRRLPRPVYSLPKTAAQAKK